MLICGHLSLCSPSPQIANSRLQTETNRKTERGKKNAAICQNSATELTAAARVNISEASDIKTTG